MPLIKFHHTEPAAELEEPPVDASIAELQSSDAHVRREAARRLGDHPDVADALCAAVAAENDESVRESIFTALMRIGTKAAAAGLIPLLQSEDVGLRNGAVEILKTMPQATAECIDATFADSVDVRIFGVEILAVLAHPDAAVRLIRIIEEDSELNVCAAAVEGLAASADPTAVAPLLRLLERFPGEPFLEFSVRAAVARIEAANDPASDADPTTS
jgi:HEAT repeat protein